MVFFLMKFRWCTLRFIPRLNHCVSYLWFFMVPKSIRQAKLYRNQRFLAKASTARFWLGIWGLGNLFDLCLCGVSLGDIMYTIRPPIDHSEFVWYRFWGEILYQGEEVKSYKNRKCGNGVLGAIRLSVLHVTMQWTNLWHPSRLESNVAASEAEIVYQNPI